MKVFARGSHRCNAAPTPTGFAEIASDCFPILHTRQIAALLLSTRQSQNDAALGFARFRFLNAE
jgi:hypothetical protein